MPYQRLARFVLDEWRAIERRLATLEPSSEEAEGLMAEANALRDEYRHLIAEATAPHPPLPEPVPEDEDLQPE
jgi:hypothetical protein